MIDPVLHTTTWLLKRMRKLKAALQECESYLEPLATAEWLADGPHANREGQLLTEVQDALWTVRFLAPHGPGCTCRACENLWDAIEAERKSA